MPRELGRGDINKDAARLRVLLASGGATTHSHADYVRIATADTITAVHTFNPATATPFILLGANASGQLITGLNADLLDGVHLSGIVQTSRQVIAGAGMTGGGALSGDVTLDVATADTSLTVNADSLQVRLATNSGLQISSGVQLGTPGSSTASSTNAVTTNSHTHAIDTTIARAAVTVTAGAGLTGGGDLSANRTIDVATADTSMTINADSIQVRLASTSGLAVSTGLMIDDGVAGNGLTIASKVLAVGVSGLGLSVTADAVVLTSSPGGAADAHIVATDASGFTEVVKLTTASIEADTDLTLNPTNDVIIAADVDLYLANGNGQIVWKNAAGSAAGGIIGYSSDNDMGIQNSVAGGDVNITVTDSDGVASPYVTFTEYGTSNDIQVRASSQLYLTSASEGISLIPYAGQSVNVSLSTTGDFVVNTDDLVVDTSSGNVSMAGEVTIGGAMRTAGNMTLYANTSTLGLTIFTTGAITASGTFTASTLVASSSVRAGTGLYVGQTGVAPDADDIHFDGNLKSVKSAVTYDVYAYYPLTTPLASTSWDGDAKTTANNGVIDLSAVFGLPADAKAVSAMFGIKAAAADIYAGLGPNVTDFDNIVVRTQIANIWNYSSGVVSLTSGDLAFVCGGNLTGVYIKIYGYWI